MAAVLSINFRDPESHRLAEVGGATFRLAIARNYCKTVARAFAKRAKEAARHCAWKTAQQIAEDTVPVKSASATWTPPRTVA